MRGRLSTTLIVTHTQGSLSRVCFGWVVVSELPEECVSGSFALSLLLCLSVRLCVCARASLCRQLDDVGE